MHHFLRYNSKTGKILGTFRSSSNQLLPKPLEPDEKHLEITDKKYLDLLAARDPRATRLVGDVESGSIRSLKVESLFRGRIVIISTLQDLDGDGLPELPADGKSVARLEARLTNLHGEVLKEDGVKVHFTLTRGVLSLREVTTKGGIAQFEVGAATETVQSRITAQADGFESASITMEFIPPLEFSELSRQGAAKPR